MCLMRERDKCVLEEKSENWNQDLIWAVGFVSSIVGGPAFKGEFFKARFLFFILPKIKKSFKKKTLFKEWR